MISSVKTSLPIYHRILWYTYGDKGKHICVLLRVDRKQGTHSHATRFWWGSKTLCFLMLLRAWFRLFPLFCNPASLFSLQYHLVCHDQQAQHPVPLRPITPDPAMLCCQGAAQLFLHFMIFSSLSRFYKSPVCLCPQGTRWHHRGTCQGGPFCGRICL